MPPELRRLIYYEHMISYAQNFEDVILERFFKEKTTGFYVDAGAADPCKNSVTKHFYDKGWCGINIEPSPRLFEKLLLERTRDINLNIAVSNRETQMVLFDFPNSGLSTIYQDYASITDDGEQVDYDGRLVSSCEKIQVETGRLTTILTQHAAGIEIDFLKIDVEGAEKEVVESNNWHVFRPKIVVIESVLPKSRIASFESWDPLLIQAGYIFVYFDGLNRFYVRNDMVGYSDLLSYPPCVFDNFMQYAELVKQTRLTEVLTQYHDLQVHSGELQSNHQELQSKYRDIESKYRKIESDLRDLQSQNQQLQTQNLDLFNQVNAILNSYLWRLMSPLRFLILTCKIMIKTSSGFIAGFYHYTWKMILDFLCRIKSGGGQDQTKEQNHTQMPWLAYFSPLPPERSGISDYSAELLTELAGYYKIDVIVIQSAVSDPWIRTHCGIRSYEWFRVNAAIYDRVIYHFGNSPHHRKMFSFLENYPGIVVLHDFYLSHIIAYLEDTGMRSHALSHALYHSHGYVPFLHQGFTENRAKVVWDYPGNLEVLQNALGVIVHSQYACRLAAQWYGDNAVERWSVIPMLRVPSQDTDKNQARTQLNLDPGHFIVCSFGMLGPTKMNRRLLDAWLNSTLAKDENCMLVFVGENEDGDYGKEMQNAIKVSGFSHRIRITGWTNLDMFRKYLATADLGVQLRALTRGETSAAIMDCMNYGLTTIVNATGSISELPDDVVYKISDGFDDSELINALETLRKDDEKRTTIAIRARDHIRQQHSPGLCAKNYARSVELFYERNQEALALASSPSKKLPVNPRQKQLFVDISAVCQKDIGTGIQRVVRAVLSELLKSPPEGFRVEPVYGIQDKPYRYARKFTMRFLNYDQNTLEDELVDHQPGDVFLGLDLLLYLGNSDYIKRLNRDGVRVIFVVYDLLPVLFPHYFPPGTKEEFEAWLRTIIQGSGAVCISKSTADDVKHWMETNLENPPADFKIGWFHLGADIHASAPSVGMPKNADGILNAIRVNPAFLMVSTIEPRKGYTQTLDAFELLWNEGREVNLVIVGHKGWMVEPLIERLKKHPEVNRRLFWLDGISDQYLEKVYGVCTCLLAAAEGEGFGIPIIEAARYKMPVLARDLPVFREIAGENACYFSGLGPDDLASAIKIWLNHYKEGRIPASEKISFLTWAQSTKQLKELVFDNQWQYRPE